LQNISFVEKMQTPTPAFAGLAPPLSRGTKRRTRAGTTVAAPVFMPRLHIASRRQLGRASARAQPVETSANAKLEQPAKQESIPELSTSVENDSVPSSSSIGNLTRAGSNAVVTALPDEEVGLVKFSLLGRNFAVPGRYLLYCVPFLWGTFGPAVRLLFAADPHPDPSLFNTERLLLANVVYAPILFAEVGSIKSSWAEKKTSHASDAIVANSDDEPTDVFLSIRAGLELGAYVFCANVAQVVGLQQTSASRAAFLVQLQTVFIPVIAASLGISKVNRNTWIGSVVAVAGVALLSSDKSHGTESSVVGDSLEILSALFFSAYVIRLSAYCNRINPAALVAVKIFVQGFLSTIWALSVEAIAITAPHGPLLTGSEIVHPWTPYAIAVNVGVIAWTGLFSSAVSGWLQTKGQQYVPASEAAIVFATQPLWASATAAVVLGEAFGTKGLAGGALILFATVFSSLSGADDKSERKNDIADTLHEANCSIDRNISVTDGSNPSEDDDTTAS
jgi:drug/metabolite transporter (DMT)-like permease